MGLPNLVLWLLCQILLVRASQGIEGEEQGRLQRAAETQGDRWQQRAAEPQGDRWQQRGSVQQGWQGGGQGGWRLLRLPDVGQGEEQPSGIQEALEGADILDPAEQPHALEKEWEGEEQPYGRQWDFEGADESYGRNPHLEGGDRNHKRQQEMLEAGQEDERQHSLEEENWYRGQKESLGALKILLHRAALFRKRYKYPEIQIGWEGAGQSHESQEATELCNQQQACGGEEQLLDREQKRADKVSRRKKRSYQKHESSLYAELPQLSFSPEIRMKRWKIFQRFFGDSPDTTYSSGRRLGSEFVGKRSGGPITRGQYEGPTSRGQPVGPTRRSEFIVTYDPVNYF